MPNTMATTSSHRNRYHHVHRMCSSHQKAILATIPEIQPAHLLMIMTDKLKELNENNKKNSGASRGDNIFTNIALGNCIQDIMSTQNTSTAGDNSRQGLLVGDSTNSSNNNNNNNNTFSSISSTTSNTAQYHIKSIEELKREEALGAPIPQKKHTTITVDCGDYNQGVSVSGRSSPSHHFYGSPGSPPMYLSPTGTGTGASNSSRPGSTRVSRAASPCPIHAGSSQQSASGTSAVAIDNKIEQAMDLVKSHLMFAVREEVEVLKEKIAELMDRINQLESENTILKQNATQETLSQLSVAAPPKVPPPNPTNG